MCVTRTGTTQLSMGIDNTKAHGVVFALRSRFRYSSYTIFGFIDRTSSEHAAARHFVVYVGINGQRRRRIRVWQAPNSSDAKVCHGN